MHTNGLSPFLVANILARCAPAATLPVLRVAHVGVVNSIAAASRGDDVRKQHANGAVNAPGFHSPGSGQGLDTEVGGAIRDDGEEES